MSVHYETRGSVAVITIDRPARRNAVDGPTADALEKAWRRFAADETARVGVLTGTGGHFSAGADLQAFDLRDRDVGYLGFTRLQSPKPTIAAVDGYCVAGGLEMALWCDLRVAGADAVFGCFERRWGVPLVDGGTQRLVHVVGLSRALDLVMTGRRVGAEEALRIGLADRLVTHGAALDAAVELGATIAAFPQETVLSDRAAILAGLGRRLEEGLAVERVWGRGVMDTAVRGAARFATGEGRHGDGVSGL